MRFAKYKLSISMYLWYSNVTHWWSKIVFVVNLLSDYKGNYKTLGSRPQDMIVTGSTAFYCRKYLLYCRKYCILLHMYTIYISFCRNSVMTLCRSNFFGRKKEKQSGFQVWIIQTCTYFAYITQSKLSSECTVLLPWFRNPHLLSFYRKLHLQYFAMIVV